MAVSACNYVEPVYEIWIAMYFVVLSWLIAFVIAGWIIYHFFNVSSSTYYPTGFFAMLTDWDR
jgi:hypothetical protein